LPEVVDDERRIEQELRGEIRRLQNELNLVNQGGRRGRLVPTGAGARV